MLRSLSILVFLLVFFIPSCEGAQACQATEGLVRGFKDQGVPQVLDRHEKQIQGNLELLKGIAGDIKGIKRQLDDHITGGEE